MPWSLRLSAELSHEQSVLLQSTVSSRALLFCSCDTENAEGKLGEKSAPVCQALLTPVPEHCSCEHGVPQLSGESR